MLTQALKSCVLEEDGAMVIDWFAVSAGLLGLGAVTTAAVVGTMAASPIQERAAQARAVTAAPEAKSTGTWRAMALGEEEVRAVAAKAAAMQTPDLERMQVDLTPYARAEVTADPQVKRLSDTYFLVRAELEAREAK